MMLSHPNVAAGRCCGSGQPGASGQPARPPIGRRATVSGPQQPLADLVLGFDRSLPGKHPFLTDSPFAASGWQY